MSEVGLKWSAVPGDLQLKNGDVHVFAAPLDLPPSRLTTLVATLSEDEWQRAGRIRLPRDRMRFLAGRGTLREILGALLKAAPASLLFSYGQFGKPHLAAPPANPPLHFNLAHSDNIALYAVARHEVGVDLERIRAMDGAEQIASRFFSPREEARFLALPPERRLEGFFNCWTRKEAYLKAVGLGLDDCLPQVEVSFTPDEPVELLSTPAGLQRCSLAHLFPAPDFVGALASQPPDSRLHCWAWKPDGSPHFLRAQI